MDFFTSHSLNRRLHAEACLGKTVVLKGDRFKRGDDFHKLASGIAAAEVGQNVYVSMGAMGQDTYTLTEHTANGEHLWQYEPQQYAEDFVEWFSVIAD